MEISIPKVNPTQFIKDKELEVWKSTSMPFLDEHDYWTKWDDTKTNKAWVSKHIPIAQRVGIWKNGKLLHVQTKNKQAFYFLLDETQTQAVYAVRYNVISCPGLPEACCQTSLWRDSASAQSVSIAAWVFFHKLLPRFGSVLSDGVQSNEGKAFWLRRCFEAEELGYYVYAVHTDKGKAISVQPARLTSLKWTTRLWSTVDKSFQNRRLLITSSRLKPINT